MVVVGQTLLFSFHPFLLWMTFKKLTHLDINIFHIYILYLCIYIYIFYII